MLDTQDWRGEHFIRAPLKPDEPEHQEPAQKMLPGPLLYKRAATPEELAHRRKIVRKHIKSGMTASEIGRAVGVPSATIYKDAKVLGLKCRNAKGKDT